jgi:hypothetical protein
MLIRGTRLMWIMIAGCCICRLFNGVDQGTVQINLIIKQSSNQKNISPDIFHSIENPWSSDKTVLGPLSLSIDKSCRRTTQNGKRGEKSASRNKRELPTIFESRTYW